MSHFNSTEPGVHRDSGETRFTLNTTEVKKSWNEIRKKVSDALMSLLSLVGKKNA